MALDTLADWAKLSNSLEYTADKIREKTGSDDTIYFDYENETGFGDAIEDIQTGGNYQAKTGITPTTSSQTITPDSGYDALSSVQIDAMPSGTAGTPTATKGTVSNHSVTVTPSVTNAAGYIDGGTKTGTGVSVSASELVSGNLAITQNTTSNLDVTNYATVSVAVPVGKSAQIAVGVKRTNSAAYVDVGFEITVAKAGKYGVYWAGYRNNTGGTFGAQVYINDNAYGSAVTTFDSTYASQQAGHVSGVTLAANDKVTIYARARSSSYYMYIMNPTIIEE